MNRIVPIKNKTDIFPQYLQSPIEKLLEYHNLDRPLDTTIKAQMLIGMCMDNRNHLRIPETLRTLSAQGVPI